MSHFYHKCTADEQWSRCFLLQLQEESHRHLKWFMNRHAIVVVVTALIIENKIGRKKSTFTSSVAARILSLFVLCSSIMPTSKKSNLDVPLELQAGGESLHQASLPPLWLPTFGHHYWYRWWLNRKKIMILDMTITKAEVICRHLLPLIINVNIFQP